MNWKNSEVAFTVKQFDSEIYIWVMNGIFALQMLMMGDYGYSLFCCHV
jgi:hypothetical protein